MADAGRVTLTNNMLRAINDAPARMALAGDMVMLRCCEMGMVILRLLLEYLV